MNGYEFSFGGTTLIALGSGALYWPEEKLLCVSDLHLGKTERYLRLGRAALPPYEGRDTLFRLESDLTVTAASTVICLGDSFDDQLASQALSKDEKQTITQMQAGRKWIWIEGNHDPDNPDLGGTHLNSLQIGSLTFRHIADPNKNSEISGHYHPKITLYTKGCAVTRKAFLVDKLRIILPAYGTYTGGLRSSSATLQALMGDDAKAILTGETPRAVPMPR